ncbi:MAG TPA: molybdenum-pterin-binding protein [Pelotomaculum sp.]|mgnify:CR=1 FL=1|nr:molybdenum-pterin-binding protein [Pelotomaculum sp.]
MKLSTRNQLKGTIKKIDGNEITSEVLIDVGGQEMCAVITTGSVKRLELAIGDRVRALVKATSVMVLKE